MANPEPEGRAPRPLGALLRRVRAALSRGVPGGDPGRRATGRRGERAACRFLRGAGYRVLGRNVRSRLGEADVVCLDPDGRTIVIVEVKSRRLPADARGAARQLPPEASVTSDKSDKLREMTRSIVRANRWQDRPVRIDVVAVEWPAERGRPTVRHHVGAV
jgi:putative endonuclease